MPIFMGEPRKHQHGPVAKAKNRSFHQVDRIFSGSLEFNEVSQSGGCRRDTLNQTTTIMKRCIYTLSALAIATSLSFAQDKPAGDKPPGDKPATERQRPSAEESFKKLDTNGDGSLSLAEFKAGPMGQKDPAKAEEIYKKMDTKGNGKVTLEEFKAGRPQHAPGKGGPGGPHKGAPHTPPAAPAAPAPASE